MKPIVLKPISRVLLAVCGVALLASIFVPIWAIYLEAPQYPEGLSMFLHANKITGDVDIINGLNHYIGMRKIHQDDFWEFKIMPYALGFFSLLCFIAAFVNKKSLLTLTCILFLIFGVAFMVDFWLWEYDYGHNLDPNAAIVVPGMAYQPPLFGFKQLLNFGAYSYPDLGGWMMIAAAGILMLLTIYEWRRK
ncbi:hypothetical protein [Riemerella columbina]|uniref:hypothetical protein n=1 Tax=Riemerella columbina TaxID=103810 RepID=UPI0026701A5C|nr:hypothetical protein [Riemerella columbina]WKS95760.1 hypothetical protein NYR17_03205 [Riemerella columbina]